MATFQSRVYTVQVANVRVEQEVHTCAEQVQYKGTKDLISALYRWPMSVVCDIEDDPVKYPAALREELKTSRDFLLLFLFIVVEMSDISISTYFLNLHII